MRSSTLIWDPVFLRRCQMKSIILVRVIGECIGLRLGAARVAGRTEMTEMVFDLLMQSAAIHQPSAGRRWDRYKNMTTLLSFFKDTSNYVYTKTSRCFGQPVGRCGLWLPAWLTLYVRGSQTFTDPLMKSHRSNLSFCIFFFTVDFFSSFLPHFWPVFLDFFRNFWPFSPIFYHFSCPLFLSVMVIFRFTLFFARFVHFSRFYIQWWK